MPRRLPGEWVLSWRRSGSRPGTERPDGGALVLSDELHEDTVHEGKRVLFLPLSLSHRVPSLFASLFEIF